MTTMIDYWLLLRRGGQGGGRGGSTKPQFDVKVVNERKLAGMICMQPQLDVSGVVEACRPPQAARRGERAGRMRCCRSLGWTAMAIAIATVWGKKGLDKGEGEGELKDGFFFMLFYFVMVFWLALFNAGQLISYQDQVNCWTGFSCKISLPVIQIWSSHFCLAIIVWESTVAYSCIRHWHKTGIANFLRSSILISYWLLRFEFAS